MQTKIYFLTGELFNMYLFNIQYTAIVPELLIF
jgi:hypothetical protein